MQHHAGKLLLILLASLALPACTPWWASETPLPLTTKVIDELPKVNNSTSAPCRMQREVAKQWSFIHTIQQGKTVVYQAPCDVDKPAPAKVASSQ
jgi:hypothetical protein